MSTCLEVVGLTGMYPEWWLHKGILNLRNLVIFNISAQTVSRIPCRHFVSRAAEPGGPHFSLTLKIFIIKLCRPLNLEAGLVVRMPVIIPMQL